MAVTSTGSFKKYPTAGYAPPQWAQPGAIKNTLSLTIVGKPLPPVTIGGVTTPATPVIVIYVFDALIAAEHAQEIVTTKQPVQTGASLTDHAYRLPARVSVEILMSDSMQSFTAGQFGQLPSRSVSAFDTLQSIAGQFLSCTVTTRLRSYSNMLIVDLRADERSETRYGGKFSVTFEEIITVQTNSTTSAIPQSTQITQGGPTQTLAVPSTIASQFGVATPTVQNVPNAGNWSSDNVTPTGQLAGFPATAVVLPLSAQPNQSLSATINGQSLQLGLAYNAIGGFWAMDISDQTGVPILQSVPLITGEYPGSNILAAYQHLKLGSAYVINLAGSSDDGPNANDLGTTFILIWDQQTLA